MYVNASFCQAFTSTCVIGPAAWASDHVSLILGFTPSMPAAPAVLLPTPAAPNTTSLWLGRRAWGNEHVRSVALGMLIPTLRLVDWTKFGNALAVMVLSSVMFVAFHEAQRAVTLYRLSSLPTYCTLFRNFVTVCRSCLGLRGWRHWLRAHRVIYNIRELTALKR